VNRRLILAAFALAILFSMVREWSAPVACPFLGLARTTFPAK